MGEGAKKIIEGLKQAALSARCDHDWELQEGRTAFRGEPMKLVYHCPYCGVHKTEFVK